MAGYSEAFYPRIECSHMMNRGSKNGSQIERDLDILMRVGFEKKKALCFRVGCNSTCSKSVHVVAHLRILRTRNQYFRKLASKSFQISGASDLVGEPVFTYEQFVTSPGSVVYETVI